MDPDKPLAREIKGASSTLRLSEGCSHPCSFCVIPRLRGPVQSRNMDTILSEARELAAQGVEEFSIIAQDSGDWGRDKKTKGNLPALLARDHGAFRACAGSVSCTCTPPHLPTTFRGLRRASGKLSYLDMPFQHIDTAMSLRHAPNVR